VHLTISDAAIAPPQHFHVDVEEELRENAATSPIESLDAFRTSGRKGTDKAPADAEQTLFPIARYCAAGFSSFGFSIRRCVSVTAIIAADPYQSVRSGTKTPALTAGSSSTSF
jgi:hypothetical protein